VLTLFCGCYLDRRRKRFYSLCLEPGGVTNPTAIFSISVAVGAQRIYPARTIFYSDFGIPLLRGVFHGSGNWCPLVGNFLRYFSS